MFNLQFVNALTQEILREIEYDKKDTLLEMIESFEEDPINEHEKQCFLFDDRGRTLDAKYITHKKVRENGRFVYKLFFNVKLHTVQVPLRKI